MRLMQAEQFIFHSRKCCKFGLRFLPLVVIENALLALIPNTLYAILLDNQEIMKILYLVSKIVK
jgi:hypothetical protein